jgi:hypothetical protein
MKRMKKQMVATVLLSLLVSCFPEAKTPNAPSPQTPPAVVSSSSPEVIVSPSPSEVVPPGVPETIQQILTSPQLALQVNEELMLIGDLRLNSGRTVSFDELQSSLNFENQNPELLTLNTQNRLIKAIKSGEATVLISSKANPELQIPIRVNITPAPSGIGADEALVDLEIK